MKIVFKKFNGFRDENKMSISSACCLFHVPATLKGDTVFSCDAKVWTVKIYATFWLIFSAATPSDLQSLQELGEGNCLSKKAQAMGAIWWRNWEGIAVE